MLYLYYMIFLDAWVIVFKHLRIFCITHLLYLISLFFENLNKTKFNFKFKIIYLSIHFLHVGLDVRIYYDSINTIFGLITIIMYNRVKFLNLIMYWIFGLITSHLKCFAYSGDEFDFDVSVIFPFLFNLNCSFVEFYKSFLYVSQCFWLYGRKN